MIIMLKFGTSLKTYIETTRYLVDYSVSLYLGYLQACATSYNSYFAEIIEILAFIV